MHVFVVHHAYESDGAEESKLIGVYSSRDAAEQAVARARTLPGFVDHPDGFSVDDYVLDEDHWTQGFVTVRY